MNWKHWMAGLTLAAALADASREADAQIGKSDVKCVIAT